MVFTKQNPKLILLKLHQAYLWLLYVMLSIEVNVKGGNHLTANQIAYASHLESKRSNVTRETETERHNRASIGLGYSNLAETRRSNLVRESQGQQNIDENVRHNVVQESIGWDNLANQERLTDVRLAEQELAVERLGLDQIKQQEIERANRAQESLQEKARTAGTGTKLVDTFMRGFPMWYTILNPGGITK